MGASSRFTRPGAAGFRPGEPRQGNVGQREGEVFATAGTGPGASQELGWDCCRRRPAQLRRRAAPCASPVRRRAGRLRGEGFDRRAAGRARASVGRESPHTRTWWGRALLLEDLESHTATAARRHPKPGYQDPDGDADGRRRLISRHRPDEKCTGHADKAALSMAPISTAGLETRKWQRRWAHAHSYAWITPGAAARSGHDGWRSGTAARVDSSLRV